MNPLATRVAWFRLTRGHAGAIGSLGALVALVGAIAGLGIASMAGGRSTENSYSTLLAKSNPSAMSVTIGAPLSTSKLAKLPGVAHVEANDQSFYAFPLSHAGAPVFGGGLKSGDVVPEASLDGEFFNQDRVSVVAGRMADPRRANEFVTTALGERLMGWHLGERIRMGFFSSTQIAGPNFGSSSTHPTFIRNEKLVGTVVFTNAVVQDAIDIYPTIYLFTPAAAKKLTSSIQYVQYNFQLTRSSNVAKVEREIIAALPVGATYLFQVTSIGEDEVNRSIRPEALALGVFGALAFAAALLAGLQLISRRLLQRRSDQEVMRAFGADNATLMADSVMGPLIASIGASLVAYVVATALSPFTTLGPVRPLLPEGLRFGDETVLSSVAFLVVVLAVATVLLALRLAPSRRFTTRSRSTGSSRVARLAMNAGLSAPAVTGIHFAFDSGHGRRAVPVRSVLVGVVLSVALIGTTLTFASGLSTLVSRPALYGWNWDRALVSQLEIPSSSIAVLAHASRLVEYSSMNFGDVQIDGITVPSLLTQPNSRVNPPLLSGHRVRSVNQIVLGAATMALLHKHVGQTVVASYGTKQHYPVYVPPTRLTIVGTATLPAVGFSGTLHPSMGVGAIIDQNIEPTAFRDIIRKNQTIPGIDIVFVRFRQGVSAVAATAVLRRAALVGDAQYAALSGGKGGGARVNVIGVQYPAEIINYRSTGKTPLWLALAFALGVAIVFGLTIGSSVRQRRRELALLKTLGFTRRQLSASIAWQASSSVAVGIVIGIPLGILFGRALWTIFAKQIYAVPLATVPTISLLVLGVAAFVLANLVAIVPRRAASRTPAGIALRAE